MNIPEKFHAVGLIGSRTGAGAQIQAVDDAVKATSTEVISIEIPRDTKGWGGHGNFIRHTKLYPTANLIPPAVKHLPTLREPLN